MPFEARTTSSGGMMVGTEMVTIEDGLAALDLVQHHPEWSHLVIDVAASDSPFILPRSEELADLHRLVREVRDLHLPRGFKIAIVRGPRSGARVADFVDLARSIALDLDVDAFDTVDDALTWVDATIDEQ